MDMILFGGQSNMEGQTEGCPDDRTPVPSAIEYKYLENRYTALQHPAGEDIPPYFGGACFGGGCILPDFCRAYQRVRNTTVAAVSMPLGATHLGQWMPGTEQYEMVLKKARAAIAAAPEAIEHLYYVWLQGESDALIGRSEEDYLSMLTVYKDALKRDLGIEKFAIIRVGYFAICYGHPRTNDAAIMEAQERACREDDDFLMLTRLTEFLSQDNDYINPFEKGHYNNRAFILLGNDAGNALAVFAKNHTN